MLGHLELSDVARLSFIMQDVSFRIHASLCAPRALSIHPKYGIHLAHEKLNPQSYASFPLLFIYFLTYYFSDFLPPFPILLFCFLSGIPLNTFEPRFLWAFFIVAFNILQLVGGPLMWLEGRRVMTKPRAQCRKWVSHKCHGMIKFWGTQNSLRQKYHWISVVNYFVKSFYDRRYRIILSYKRSFIIQLNESMAQVREGYFNSFF